MNPSQVTQIYSKVYGGEDAGSLNTFRPESLKDVASFFNNVNLFLEESDARMVELTLINKQGQKALRRMYKKVLVTPAVAKKQAEQALLNDQDEFSLINRRRELGKA